MTDRALLQQTARRSLAAALSLFVGAPPSVHRGINRAGNAALDGCSCGTVKLSGLAASPGAAPATESPPAAPTAADLPRAAWAMFAQPANAPAAGHAWAMDHNGSWRQVPIAPGGRIVNGHYIPPQRPGGPREPASADVRFTDAKRIAANACVLKEDWKMLYWAVAPRGAPDIHGVSPGHYALSNNIDYFYEGGSTYPQITASQKSNWPNIASQAKSLWSWWKNPPWPRWYTSAASMGWYRVFVDDQGYRNYKPWTLAGLQRYFDGWELAAPGYSCPHQETYRNAALTMKCGIDMHGTNNTVLKVCEVWAYSRCSPSQTAARNHYLKVAAVVTGAVFGGIALAHLVAAHAAAAGAAASSGSSGASAGASAASTAGHASLLHTVAVSAVPLAINKAGHVVPASQAGSTDQPILDSALSTFKNVAGAAQSVGANVPALPTSSGSSSLIDWAKQIALQHLQSSGQTVTPSDAQTLQTEIQQLQSRLVARNGNYASNPTATVAPPGIQQQIANALGSQKNLMLIGLGLAAALAFSRK